MPTVYIVHAESDRNFVQLSILPVLFPSGFEFWLSSTENEKGELPNSCELSIIVLSPEFVTTTQHVEKLKTALDSNCTLIVVKTNANVGELSGNNLPAKVWALPMVDFGNDAVAAQDILLDILPPLHTGPEDEHPENARRIAWNEAYFSQYLDKAITRRDYPRAEALISAIVNHLKHRSELYPENPAAADLQMLRQDRRFKLMQRYGEAVIASGTRKDKVLRLYAQALIEVGKYDQALDLLNVIINNPNSEKSEIFEARGLIGRVYKQRYVNAPHAPEARSLLQKAIDAYKSAYDEDHKNIWQGVNAVSCMLRAGFGRMDMKQNPAERIALQIVKDLDELSQNGQLSIWDHASRIEALLALGRYEEAEEALNAYINHPEMTAFEVTSTFRQFDQVLQLGSIELGQKILERLRNAMIRLRVSWSASRSSMQTLATGIEGGPVNHMIIRLSTSEFDAAEFPGLVIQSQLGTVVTARGSGESISRLLAHPSVISVEESQPAGYSECNRSVPFVKVGVNASYSTASGAYTERGDAAMIAFIDDGIDILHEAFLDASGKSRIVGIRDQTDTDSEIPPSGFSYGKFYDAGMIEGYISSKMAPPGLRKVSSEHGTHVASIAGGRAVGDFAGGVAPDARLLFVVSAAMGPTGYSQSHIDALSFIDRFAKDQNLPVVVNVSQGKNAGAHDGMSSLEAAFDAFSGSGRILGRVVVKSAGNERGKGGHAKVTMMPNSVDDLTWKRQKGADYFDRIELWFSSADECSFRLQCPESESTFSDRVGTSNPECSGTFLNGGPYRLTFIKRHIDNGDSLLAIELGDERTAAATGEWKLEIQSETIGNTGEMHAWLERNQGVPSAFTSHVDEEMTLSVPGTARSVMHSVLFAEAPRRSDYRQVLYSALMSVRAEAQLLRKRAAQPYSCLTFATRHCRFRRLRP